MKNILFVPGWMRNGSSESSYKSIEIWQSEVDESKIQADVLIGYSGAAFFCLEYWQTHKNTKLILVNPLLGKTNFFGWIAKWLKTYFFEGFKNFGDILPLKFLWFNLKKFWELNHIDNLSIIKTLPQDKLVVIKGEKDIFCDPDILQALSEVNYLTKIVPGEGHNWSEKFSLEVKKYIN